MGVASCYGAQDVRCADAPQRLSALGLKETLEIEGLDVKWNKNIYPNNLPKDNESNKAIVLSICQQTAKQTKRITSNKEPFVVIGGDHSCAIGTWSGAYASLNDNQALGLIWIDAHMDSHIPESSPSKAIHGMPVAALLGFGDKAFCHIEKEAAKLNPKNLCLVGIRSFEKAEKELLNKLGVKVYYMEDVHRLGLDTTLKLAKSHVEKNGQPYGLSIDIDAIDPSQAPGVGSPEKGGINGDLLIDTLRNMRFAENFIGLEVAELNASKDNNDKTAKLAINIIQAVFSQ